MNMQEPRARPEAETEDAHPLLVGVIATSLVLIIGFGLLGGFLIVGRADIQAEKLAHGSAASFEHGVVEASDISRSWAEIDQSSAPDMEGYAWIDRRAGIVRVPIGRAIDLICAEQGAQEGNRAERRDSP
jgi:hypothetical protein